MMTDAAAQIADLTAGFKQNNWSSEPMRKALQIATQSPQSLSGLVSAIMRDLPQGGVYLHAALSHLPALDWPSLVEQAVWYLQRDLKNKAALSIIEYAGLQSVTSTHPHLQTVFRLERTLRGLSECFRETAFSDVEFLRPLVAKEHSERACYLLMESRLQQAFRFILEHSPSHIKWLPEFGYERVDDAFRKLYPERLLHLAFPMIYLAEMPLYGEKIPWQFVDPTWPLADIHIERHRFGGTSETVCGGCGRLTPHLVTLDPMPEGLYVTELPRLQLVACLSCLGWERERLYYQHDTTGKPSIVGRNNDQINPRFPAVPLKQTEVALSDLGPRWRWQDWGMSNGRENLHRLGGHPTWVQDGDYPQCLLCERAMTFLMQLDSELLTEDGGQWLWGSGGICYIHWCDGCKVSSLAWQCT